MCFTNYVRAGYPIMWVQTHEEFRLLTEYTMQISKLKVKEDEALYQAFVWDVAEGIHPIGIKNGV